MNLKKMFEMQKRFSDLFFTIDKLDEISKEEITKSLALELHSEVSELISAINFKDHRRSRTQIDQEKILYESIDVFRYLLAILNLWDISCDQFVSAFEDKDLFLHARYDIEETTWEGQPVLIFDLDDVICEFRSSFIGWLNEKYNVNANVNSSEYYTTAELAEAGLNPEGVFENFIVERRLRLIEPDQKIIDMVNGLYESGFWIHILTARPDSSLVCKYDTFRWLSQSGLKFHRIDFSPEKYRWLTKSEYYNHGKIVCAIDDSAKHCAEYAKHGIKVCAPIKTYNREIRNVKNIHMYKNDKELLDCIKKLSDSMYTKDT